MSAFMCAKSHIDYLVSAALHLPGFDPVIRIGQANETGRMLRRENAASLGARYADPSDMFDEAPELYIYPQCAIPVEPVQVLKAIDCYEYQSSEHAGWETSEARRFCEQLRARAIRALPGYEQAAWEVVMA